MSRFVCYHEVGSSRLPALYQEVTSITSHGQEYIDLGFVPTAPIYVHMKVNVSTETGNDSTLIGCSEAGCTLNLMVHGDLLQLGAGPWQNVTQYNLAGNDEVYDISFVNGSNSVKRNGSVVATVSSSITPSNNTWGLFANHYPHNRTWNYFASMTLYECTISDANGVIHDYVPCYEKQGEQRVGLYDIKTNQFLYNISGSGGFDKGEDTGGVAGKRFILYNEAAGRRLPLRYQEVEYLQSNGSQWIDTEVQQTSTMCVDMKLSQVSVSNNYLYGARQSNQAMIYNGLYSNNALEFNWLTINYTASNNVTMTQEIVDNQMHITINDQEFTRALGTADNNNIFLFGCNNSSVRTYTSLKVYYFILHDGDFRRTFIPCYDKENNNKPGLYELTEGKFYINKGSGTDFSYGADVSPAVPTRFVLYRSTNQWIYLNGDEYTDLTGGWKLSVNGDYWGSAKCWDSGSKNTDHIFLRTSLGGAAAICYFYNQTPIDFSKRRVLHFIISDYWNNNPSNNLAKAAIFSQLSDITTDNSLVSVPITTSGEYTLDLTNITTGYLAIGVGLNNGTTEGRIYKIWLE